MEMWPQGRVCPSLSGRMSFHVPLALPASKPCPLSNAASKQEGTQLLTGAAQRLLSVLTAQLQLSLAFFDCRVHTHTSATPAPACLSHQDLSSQSTCWAPSFSCCQGIGQQDLTAISRVSGKGRKAQPAGRVMRQPCLKYP